MLYTIEVLNEEFGKHKVTYKRRKRLIMLILLSLDGKPAESSSGLAVTEIFNRLPEEERPSRNAVALVIRELRSWGVIGMESGNRKTYRIWLEHQLDPALIVHMRKETGWTREDESHEGAAEVPPEEERSEEPEAASELPTLELPFAKLAPVLIQSLVAWISERGLDGVLEDLQGAISDFQGERRAELEILEHRLTEAEERAAQLALQLTEAREGASPQAIEQIVSAPVLLDVAEPAPHKYVSARQWPKLGPREFAVFQAALRPEATLNRRGISQRLDGKVKEEEVEQLFRAGTEPMLYFLSNSVADEILEEDEKRMITFLVQNWGPRPYRRLFAWLGDHTNTHEFQVDFLKLANDQLNELNNRLPSKMKDSVEKAMEKQVRRHARSDRTATHLDASRGHHRRRSPGRN